jgi:hypothetical protein
LIIGSIQSVAHEARAFAEQLGGFNEQPKKEQIFLIDSYAPRPNANHAERAANNAKLRSYMQDPIDLSRPPRVHFEHAYPRDISCCCLCGVWLQLADDRACAAARSADGGCGAARANDGPHGRGNHR